jgi:superfamily II DNA/RNA helicase
MMARGYFQTDELDVLVIDEADEMLKMGFKE